MKLTEYVVKLFIRYKNHKVTALASQLAFDILFSFFPFIIFLLTIIGYANVNPMEVLDFLEKFIPTELYTYVYTIIPTLLQTRNRNLMSFSLIVFLYTASRGFRAVIYGLNSAYEEEEHRLWIKVVSISIITMILVSIIIVFLLSFFVFGEMISNALVNWLGIDVNVVAIAAMLRYPIGICGMIIIFTFVYKFTPCKKLKWKEVFPGAVFTSILWIVLSLGFSFYVNNFGKYSDLYGSIGVIIVLMLYIQIISNTILLGGELNALLLRDRELKAKL